MITITAKELQAAIVATGRAVPSQSSSTIPGSLLLVADKSSSKISLTGFDLDLGITVKIDAEITQSTSLMIPAKPFSEIVSKAEGVIELEPAAPLNLVIRTQTGRYQIQGGEPGDFIAPPEVEAEPIVIPTALLRAADSVLFSASTDESKQILCGVHLSQGSEAIKLYATDGHRLTTYEYPITEEIQIPSVTIPRSSLTEIVRLLKTAGETVELYVAPGIVALQWEDCRVVSRTLTATYPDCDRLIPSDFRWTLTINRKALLGAIDRISVIANQGINHRVKIQSDPSRQWLNLSAVFPDLGTGSEQIEISAQPDEDTIELSLNGKYLTEALKHLPTAEVQMHINSANTPVVITPLDGPKIMALAMPIVVRD
jgi:DNA polymerase-3 subunit beta